MIYLLFSIICSAAIYVIFKLFSRFEVHTFQAIVVNYFVAASFGFWYAHSKGAPGFSFDVPWLGWAGGVGFLFISLFYVMALTSQMYGVSVTSIATKMSMVIPVAFFIVTDPTEKPGLLKILGIMLGILAVFLASAKSGGGGKTGRAMWIPVVLFVGSGLLDLLLAFTQKTFLKDEFAYRAFVPVPFAFAALIGVGVIAFRAFSGREKIHGRTILAGAVLGLVNYGSIYFLVKVLGSEVLDRSSAIPANNMGVVALSSIIGFVVFRERLSAKNRWGILLAIVAIGLLIWSRL